METLHLTAWFSILDDHLGAVRPGASYSAVLSIIIVIVHKLKIIIVHIENNNSTYFITGRRLDQTFQPEHLRCAKGLGSKGVLSY